jgi:hypothetical protein
MQSQKKLLFEPKPSVIIIIIFIIIAVVVLSVYITEISLMITIIYSRILLKVMGQTTKGHSQVCDYPVS